MEGTSAGIAVLDEEILKKYEERELPGSFNPWDMTPYKNKVIETVYSDYLIDNNGVVSNPEKPEKYNMRIYMAGGICPVKFKYVFHHELGTCTRLGGRLTRLEVARLITDYGDIAVPGNRLMLLMNSKDVDFDKTPYIITSMIRKIHPIS